MRVASAQCVDGADRDTLSAIGAGTAGYVTLEGGGDSGVEATVDSCQCAYGLDRVTHRLATAAHDTLIGVTHDRGRAVDLELRHLTLVTDLSDTQAVR